MKTNLLRSFWWLHKEGEQVNVAASDNQATGFFSKQNSLSKQVLWHAFKTRLFHISIVLMVLATIAVGCDQLLEDLNTPPHVASTSYKQTNLVSDVTGYNALRIDTTLVNAWGIAINPNGIPWISSNGKGLSE